MDKSYTFKSAFFIVLLIILVISCVPRQEIVYFQGLEQADQQLSDNKGKSLTIKPKDQLTISVSAPEQEAAMPFNLPLAGSGNVLDPTSVSGQPRLQTYLVDDNGAIEFPVLGSLDVEGMTRGELSALLKEKISKYVRDPIVTVRIVNFQISVLGEVSRPGTFDINDEYLSLPQALGLAGDMSIYGRRDNVLVMREENGRTKHAYLNLTDADIINSPFYYLKQNDVVYVEPNDAQRQASSYNRNSGIYISIASLLVSVIVLIAR